MLRNKDYNFLFFMLIWVNVSLGQFDYNGMQTMHISRNEQFDPYFKVVTHSVTPVMCALPIASFGTWCITKEKKYLKHGLMQLEAMAINGLITLSMKELIKRPRPFETYQEIDPLVSAGSYSFPSGHTSSAFNTATSLTISCPKWFFVVPAYTWASLAGYSRIHLGVHYPSDVLIGAIVGSVTALASHYLNEWLFDLEIRTTTDALNQKK
jgi:membrane-associated phospholipid phosphatase